MCCECCIEIYIPYQPARPLEKTYVRKSCLKWEIVAYVGIVAEIARFLRHHLVGTPQASGIDTSTSLLSAVGEVKFGWNLVLSMLFLKKLNHSFLDLFAYAFLC